MAVQIQFRRGTAQEWSTENPILAEGEMGIELDTDLFKIGNGLDPWLDLDYGGLRGFLGSSGYTGSIGNIAVANVLYVSKSGNDANDGRSLNTSKLTLKAALQIATTGTTVFVKSGDYIEQNPMVVPEDCAVWGDNLRTTTIRPANKTQDLFWVRNGSYLSQMTFKDHEAPAAAVAFPPDGSAGVIFQSPYVQNCTSLTSSGTGMRVDGNHAGGTKSMVLDAYTQYNQGGIGVHLLNNGYAQLVSLFTICCDKAILCETGGNCSVTNSNSSFGNYALYADGVSEVLYRGKLKGNFDTTPTILIDNLFQKPNIGDAVKFDGDVNYYTVESVQNLLPGSTSTITPPTYAPQPALSKNVRSLVLDNKSNIQISTILFINETWPGFDYNQGKCSRDIGLIIDAALDDMVLGTNYRTVLAGTAYYRANSYEVTATQKVETIAAINYVKNEVLERVVQLASTTSYQYTTLEYNFETIVNILGNGPEVAPNILFPSPSGVTANREKARDLLQANKTFLIEEGIEWIKQNIPYNQAKCARDTGLIVDTISLDMLYDSTSESVFAGLQYWSQGSSAIPGEETTTTAAINYLKTLAVNTATIIGGSTVSNIVNDLFSTITNIIVNGTVGVTDRIISNGLPSTATNIVNTYNALQTQKSTFQSQVIEWVAANHPTFVYDTSTCIRDVGFIIDSISFDLLNGGNKQSIKSGVYYYNFDGNQSTIEFETTQTTAAYDYISSILPSIVTAQALTITYQVSVSQNISLPAATLTEASILQSKISTITNIILNGPTAAAPRVPINLTQSTSTNVDYAYDLVVANKEFIRAETIAYLNNVVFAPYNRSKCRRDTGLIVDSIAFDLLYPTAELSQSNFAGLQYWNQTEYVGDIDNELTTTTNAINYAKQLSQQVVLGITTGTRYQNTVTQVTTGTTATSIEAQIIADDFQIILNIISSGTVGVTDLIVPNGIRSTATNIVNAYNMLLDNRTYIQTEVVAFVESTKTPGFEYNTATCYRDVGYMIDSVAFDLIHPNGATVSNKQAVQSGVYYYEFSNTSTAIPREIPQTVDAYNFIRSILPGVITGVPVSVYQNNVAQITNVATGTNVQVTLLQGYLDHIVDIIQNGPSAANAKVPISLTQANNSDIQDAFSILLANRDFIQEETIFYIGATQDLFPYNQTKCRRDMGYIIDAVTYDILYEGNSQTIDNADEYYSNGVLEIPESDRYATWATFDFIGDVAGQVVQNNLVTALNTTTEQILLPPAASAAEGQRVSDLFDIVADLIRNGYSSIVTLEEVLFGKTDNTNITFHQFSLITSSGHTFEWVGAGTNINSALPSLGGTPIQENQVVQINGGRVYFTSTDQKGDFRIGNDFVINRKTGTITGRTFTKSLFVTVTPYILALGR